MSHHANRRDRSHRRPPVAERLESRRMFSTGFPELSVRAQAGRASENGTARSFTIVRTGDDLSAPLRVSYLVGGKARNGVDYGFVKSWANIAAGSATVRVTVKPVDDALAEPVEAVTLTLSPRSTYVLDDVFAATIRISDNDTVVEPPPPALPAVSVITTGHATEGAATPGGFTVSRTGDTAAPLLVHFTLDGSTATNGVDYTAIGTSVTIPAGQPSAHVNVNALNDDAVEGDESVVLKITPDAAYTGDGNWASVLITDTTPTPPPAQGTLKWTSILPMPLGRSEAMGVVINGKAYVLGGFKDYTIVPTEQMHRYDPATHEWTRVADIPWPLSHAGVAVDGNFMYVAGGYPANAAKTTQLYGTNVVRRYDSVTDTWSTIQSLPEMRATGALVVVGRELHWVTGTDIQRNDRAEHWSLNLDDPTAKWETRAPIPTARNHVGHVVLNGKIYIIGGAKLQDAAETASTLVEIYDPATDSWSTGPSLPTPRALVQSAATVLNGRIYLVGGENSYQRATSEATVFDPSTNKWTQLTALPGRRIAPVVLTLGNDLFVAGGYYNEFNTTTWVGSFI